DASAVLGGVCNYAGTQLVPTCVVEGYRGAATVAGGAHNAARGVVSSVGGGLQNVTLEGSASVSGGQANVASGVAASVGGGLANRASGNGASVSGGVCNVAGS